jgi:acetyl-CoA carboxylase biotin carboxyl carrier protein
MPDGRGLSASLLDPATLRRLLAELQRTDVDELEVVSGSSRLYLRREPGRHSVVPRSDSHAEESGGVPIAAPLTGVYYARSSPQHEPYVTVGSPVEPGQVVALIETMKLFNEVIADIAGEIVAVHVTEGQLVEAGQSLMSLRPREERDAG